MKIMSIKLDDDVEQAPENVDRSTGQKETSLPRPLPRVARGVVVGGAAVHVCHDCYGEGGCQE